MAAADRRAQIIEVAGALIAERGFWGMSLQDVADACGLTVAGLLHHVGSKDGLLIAVLEHRDEADSRALADILGLEIAELFEPPRIDGGGIELSRLCDALVERNAGQPEIVRLYSVLDAEALNPEHPAHAYFADRQRQTLAAFASAAPGGADGEAVARHLLAAMDGLQLQWLRDPSVDLLQEWRRIARTIDVLRA